MTSAPLSFALGLPQSFAGSAAFILVVLSVTYALLRVFITVEPVRPRGNESEDEVILPPPDESGQEEDLPVEAESSERSGSEAVTGDAPEIEQPRPPVSVEALSIHGIHVSVGDSAGHVMSAVRRRESSSQPVIDKDNAGRATRVTREYRIAEQAVRFLFERESPDQRLLLTDLQIRNA